MKRYLLIFIAILGLSSCVKRVKVDLTPSHITYNGHDYIIFEHRTTRIEQNYCFGVVHDPDCPCHKQLKDH